MSSELNRFDLDLSQGQAINESPIEVLAYQLPTVFMRMLRVYFKSGPYAIPGIDKLYYDDSESPNVRGELKHILEIERLTTYRGDQQNQAPKILIREDSVALVKHGIAGGLRMLPSVAGKGGKTYEKLWSGSIIVFCLSTVSDESRLMAFEVANLVAHYQQEIRRQFANCKSLAVTQVGATGKIKELPDFFGTPVPIDYAYVDNVSIRPLKRLPIREIVLQVNAK